VVPVFYKIENHVAWVVGNKVSKHDYRKYPSKVIHFVFSKVEPKFLKPYHITPLACLIHEYQQQGFYIKVRGCSDAMHTLLSSFNFINFCKGESAVIPLQKDKFTHPLWLIKQLENSSYIDAVTNYFQNTFLPNQDLFAVGNALGELFNNIFDHSNSKIPGYTFTKFIPERNQIILSVCDFGIGIPTKINTYLQKIGHEKLSSTDALKHATELAVSSKSQPHNAGRGLDTIRTSIKSLSGKILIVSNNTILWIKGDGSEQLVSIRETFKGTLFVIWIDTTHLPLTEELTEEISIV